MSYSKVHSFALKQNFAAIEDVGNADVTGLASGGFGLAFDNNDLATWQVFDQDGVQEGSTFTTDGFPETLIVSRPVIVQLANDNILCMADRHTDLVAYTVRGPTLGSVGIGNSASGTSYNNPDGAALALGGFVKVFENTFSGAQEIGLQFHNDAGAFLEGKTFSGGYNYAPSVAGLTDGGVVVAWHKSVGGNTEVWYAIYNANGTVRRAAGILDTVGSINRDVHLAAYGTGFVAVYSDDGWSGGDDTDISFARYDAQGVRAYVKNISLNDENDSNAHVAVLDDGLVAITYSYDFIGTNDTDTIVKLFDPTTTTTAATALATRTVLGGQASTDDKNDATVAGYGFGQVVVYHTNNTDDALNGEALQVTVTWTGDGASDTMTAAHAVDIIHAGGGADYLNGARNDDELYGEAGDDSLRGNGGADLLDGGEGSDFASDDNDAGVSASLDGSLAGTGAASGDSFVDIENISGSNSGADQLAGDALANKIYGNGGSDSLFGRDGDDMLRGGLGNDAMTGGAGADQFLFDSTLNGVNNVDTIATLSSIDIIVLDNDIFTALGASFTSSEFRAIDTGTSFASVDASDNIIYLKSTGQLFYDRDGSGTTYARVLFAEVPDSTAVSLGIF